MVAQIHKRICKQYSSDINPSPRQQNEITAIEKVKNKSPHLFVSTGGGCVFRGCSCQILDKEDVNGGQ